jgi:hypothetical protein
MSRTILVLSIMTASFACSSVAYSNAVNSDITYTKDIAPLLQEKCIECHRTEGLAPFNLESYEQVRAWSKSIRKEVHQGRMPPWGLDPEVGKWSNDPTFNKEELATLDTWLDGGMSKGNPKDMPKPREFHEDWSIGKPDMIFEMPEEIVIPADGVMPYQYHVTELNIEEDLYVQSLEVLPGNRRVVHHVIVFLQPPPAVANAMNDGFTNTMLDVYAPGSPAGINPPGVARLIPKGSKLQWQIHYTPTGEEERDRSRFGIILAKEKPKELMRTATLVNMNFEIPPHAENYKVESKMTIPTESTIYSYTPHMHYRGKAMDFYLTYPGKEEELVCSIPEYDFNWQLDYFLEEPQRVPAGTQVRLVAHFDNSAGNPFNPDPTKAVHWGEQTWEEMMMGGLFLSGTDGIVDVPEVESMEITEADLVSTKAMISAQDKNGDGALQKDEVPKGMQQFFGMVDSNGDGGVDAMELYLILKSRGQ